MQTTAARSSHISRSPVRAFLYLSSVILSLSLIVICREPYSDVANADLDRDGRPERVVINSERSRALQVWRRHKLLWAGVPSGWHPWKMQIADVDGDGRLEIAVGVFKPTTFFPRPHNCLFIFGWAGDRAFPKWLGSSLARPFTDFRFANIDHKAGEELIAIETSLEGAKSVAMYRWNGFGFTLDSREGNWQTARLINTSFENILVEADGRLITALTRKEAGNEKQANTRSVYLDISNDIFY